MFSKYSGKRNTAAQQSILKPRAPGTISFISNIWRRSTSARNAVPPLSFEKLAYESRRIQRSRKYMPIARSEKTDHQKNQLPTCKRNVYAIICTSAEAKYVNMCSRRIGQRMKEIACIMDCAQKTRSIAKPANM